jgi:hypothetical protein
MLRSVSTRLTGLTILVLGIWGGLIPFVGPYFHFTLGPDHAWTWTTGRLWLSVLPAIAAVVGGLWLLGAGPWASGRIGALLALLAGIWFTIGPDLSILWHTGGQLGAGHGSTTVQMLERLSFHTGLGVVIAALAGFALPGVVGLRARRREPLAEDTAAAGTGAPIATRTGGAATAEPAAAPVRGADEAASPPQDATTEPPTRPITGNASASGAARRERATV